MRVLAPSIVVAILSLVLVRPASAVPFASERAG